MIFSFGTYCLSRVHDGYQLLNIKGQGFLHRLTSGDVPIRAYLYDNVNQGDGIINAVLIARARLYIRLIRAYLRVSPLPSDHPQI